MKSIKNILFDLGNVLYDIDFDVMYQRFHQLGIPNFENHFTLNKSDALFFELEKGEVDAIQFCARFNQLYQLELSDSTIIDAWNSLLIGFRKDSMDWVKLNRNQFDVFLYSNTNQIHYDYFIPQYAREIGGDFNSLFKKPYYSHKMGMRKPDPTSFQFILNQEGLIAAETLFVDDNAPNIVAAASVGLKVLHLKPGMYIENELPKLLLG